jgi:hypothetical protein
MADSGDPLINDEVVRAVAVLARSDLAFRVHASSAWGLLTMLTLGAVRIRGARAEAITLIEAAVQRIACLPPAHPSMPFQTEFTQLHVQVVKWAAFACRYPLARLEFRRSQYAAIAPEAAAMLDRLRTTHGGAIAQVNKIIDELMQAAGSRAN